MTLFWILTLKVFTGKAKSFWFYTSIAHMALIAVANYGDVGRRWNISLVPVKVMWYFDLFLTAASVIHPLLYPKGYDSAFWFMVVGIPMALPVIFSVDNDPY